MLARNRLIAAAVVVLTMAVAVRAREQTQAAPPTQGQPPTTASPTQEAPAAGPQGEHGGQPVVTGQEGEPRPNQGRFPAHQRPLQDAAVIARGKALYAGACSACHGADARGGQLGGVNLLRSQLVLNDQEGELIQPVVQNGRPGTLMVPIPMSAPDVKAVAAFLHSLQAQGTNQGGPPPGEEVPLNILVGDAKAGASYFGEQCASCHSPTGDLQGLATKVPDAKMLQNLWVSGGALRLRGRRPGGPGGPAGGGAAPAPSTVFTTATVTLASGEKVEGRLVRVDDFLVSLAREDGTVQSFRREGEQPKVEIRDPRARHRELLAIYSDKNIHDVTAYLATLK